MKIKSSKNKAFKPINITLESVEEYYLICSLLGTSISKCESITQNPDYGFEDIVDLSKIEKTRDHMFNAVWDAEKSQYKMKF